MRKIAVIRFAAMWGIFLSAFSYIFYSYTSKPNRYSYTLPYAYRYPPAGTLPWIRFKWFGSTLKGKYVEKHAMCIPVKLDNIPHDFYFQFDMGSTYTMLYENSLGPYLDKYHKLEDKLVKRRPQLIFWDDSKDFSNLQLTLDTVPFTGKHVYIKRSFGRLLNYDSLISTSQKTIGTIGVDILQDHIVVIDYPNQRICITDTLPPQFQTSLSPFYLSRHGKVVLQMKYNNQIFNVIFDTGSSIFSLLTTGEGFTSSLQRKITTPYLLCRGERCTM